MNKIRVLITDDSLFMRAAIKKMLVADGRFEVIGEAKNGREAVDKVAQLRPDVCTMDFNMPLLDGAGAVREIMKTHPTPVVMLSAHTKEGARETFEALAAGERTLDPAMSPRVALYHVFHAIWCTTGAQLESPAEDDDSRPADATRRQYSNRSSIVW